MADPAPTEPPPENPARLPRWKLALFWSILLALLLGGGEFAARMGLKMYRGFDGEHLLQYEFDAYKNILPTRNFVDTRGIRHNSQGFRRDTDVSIKKPEGTYRVFLMGASTAYGLGGLWSHIQREYAVLDNSETIDAYLERRLQDRFPDQTIEVINAAITSTWTHHHLIYINQSILRYDPDMILFLDGFNDFYFVDDDHDQFASYSYNLTSRDIMGPPTVRSLIAMNGWWFFRKSALAHVTIRAGRTLRTLIRGRPPQTPMHVDRAIENFASTFEANALAMIERTGLILANEGVATVFMLQPMLILERDRPGAPEIERALFDFNVESYRPDFESFIHQAVAIAREKEQAVADRVGATFIDLTQIFGAYAGQVYTDYAHLTPEANAILADTVAARIAPLIAADSGSGT